MPQHALVNQKFNNELFYWDPNYETAWSWANVPSPTSRNCLETKSHYPRSIVAPGMCGGVGRSACALLACCCTPTLGACILSWANVPTPHLQDFFRN